MAKSTETPAPTQQPLPGFPVTISLPVQWGDQDALGHVNNIIYFRWFESARIEYLRSIGQTAEGSQNKTGVIVAAISCDFRSPVTYPDTVLIGARVSRIGNSSMTMEHTAFSQSQQVIVAEGVSTIVAFDHAAKRSQPVPETVREAIRKLEAMAVEE
jgi:acyl-CoA thioester hydrolase